MPTYATENLLLRPLALEDIRMVYDNREPMVLYYSNGITEAEFADWSYEKEAKFIQWELEEVERGKRLVFVLLLRDSGEYIGRCTLHNINRRDQNAEVSISLREKYWGHGYGAEALRCLLQIAFEEQQLHRLVYSYYSINERSGRLADKLYFVFEGRMRDAKKIGDTFCDRIVHSLLRSEYKQMPQ